MLMIRPTNFGFNIQTAESNSFQNQLKSLTSQQIQDIALLEFDNIVASLRKRGIKVEVQSDLSDSQSPDSIFPNNWFSTFTEEIILYPMTHENRRWERRPELIELVAEKLDKPVNNSLLKKEAFGLFLEGTGSLVCDYLNKVAFAALSPRTNHQVLNDFERVTGYKTVRFDTQDLKGNPIYHTNVVMTIGSNFTVIGLDAIALEHRNLVVQELENLGKTVIALTNEQLFQSFAGNMLQLQNQDKQSFVCMSLTALRSMTSEQRNTLKKLGHHILEFPIHIIETIGGGSVRCMMAELFPKH